MDAMKSIASAQSTFERDHRRGFAALNEIFRAGSPPDPPLDGHHAGQFVALDVAPGLNQLADLITARWMPWKGKTFDAASATGDNILSRDSLLLAHIVWPLYRGHKHESADRYRAFPFRTYLAPGLTDPDRQVLKLDYNLKSNPSLSVRRVLDELVQVETALYLGKAHFKWWWGKWQLVAYFKLAKSEDG
ncbi:MAG TPA: hypothetical protein VFZ43_09290 [Anaerolineales bacterium]